MLMLMFGATDVFCFTDAASNVAPAGTGFCASGLAAVSTIAQTAADITNLMKSLRGLRVRPARLVEVAAHLMCWV
jgi:hypothetical protein